MKDLAEVFVRAGCSNVETYIQSGNVIFSADRTRSEKLSDVLKAKIDLISTNLQPDPYGQLQAVLSAHGPAYASTSGPSGTRPLLELGSARLSNRANQKN